MKPADRAAVEGAVAGVGAAWAALAAEVAVVAAAWVGQVAVVAAAAGTGGGAPNEEEMQRMRETMRELMQPAARLTIVQHEDTVSFTDDQGHVRKFVANGKDEKHQLQAATLETKSAWKDGALVIQWETGRGPTVVRSYRVDPELHRLVIETSMKGGRNPGGADRPPIKHVYDAVVDAM